MRHLPTPDVAAMAQDATRAAGESSRGTCEAIAAAVAILAPLVELPRLAAVASVAALRVTGTCRFPPNALGWAEVTPC